MSKVFDTLRLSSRQLDALMSELERPVDSVTDSKRENRRWTYGAARVVLTTVDASEQVSRQIAAIRNLSSSGAAILAGTFVYPNTGCILSLKDLKGNVRNLRGDIVRCRHVQSRAHDVGVRFHESVNPREFIEFGSACAFNTEHVDLAQLKGHVLVIEDSRADQKLIAHYFKGSGIEIDYAQDGEGGLMMLADHPDLVFVCSGLRDMRGIEMIAKARGRGYGGAIILLNNESEPGDRDSFLEQGASEVLTKPVLPDLLHQAAAEYLIAQATQDKQVGRIESTADPELIPAEMLCEYIDGLQKQSDELADAIEKGDIDRLQQLIKWIEGSSGSYGFGPIMDMAGAAREQLDGTKSIEESMLQVQQLMGACQRIKRPEN